MKLFILYLCHAVAERHDREKIKLDSRLRGNDNKGYYG